MSAEEILPPRQRSAWRRVIIAFFILCVTSALAYGITWRTKPDLRVWMRLSASNPWLVARQFRDIPCYPGSRPRPESTVWLTSFVRTAEAPLPDQIASYPRPKKPTSVIAFATNASPSEVANWYQRQLRSRGWTQITDLRGQGDAAGSNSLQFHRRDEYLIVRTTTAHRASRATHFDLTRLYYSKLDTQSDGSNVFEQP